MISLLAPADDLGAITAFLEATPPELVDRLELIDYSTFLNRKTHAPGIVVLGNYELLSTAKRREVEWVCTALLESVADIRIYNYPGEALGRYHLLKELKAAGINDFDVFRPDELDENSIRFPVFIRDENMHTGSISDLLYSREELDDALSKLQNHSVGRRPADLLVVEFCDTEELGGVHRKYCAYRFGDSILAKGINFDHQWVVKFSHIGFTNLEDGVISQDRLAEDLSYAENNPHQEWVMDVFQRANIEYGRLDYGECYGRLQAWEINTHPEMGRRPMKKRTPEQLKLREKLRSLRVGKREKFRADLFGAMENELDGIAAGEPVSVEVPTEIRMTRLKNERSGQYRDAVANSARPFLTWCAGWIPENGWIGKTRKKCRDVVYRFLEPRNHRTHG